MSELILSGLSRKYPKYQYSTDKMIEILGNKLSKNTIENIKQLGVNNRYFVKPFEHYLTNTKSTDIFAEDYVEPISDLTKEVALDCLDNLGINKNEITCLVSASENSDYLSPGLSSLLVRKIGMSNFIPHFNIQGMACSTLPKLLELGKSLVKNEDDKVLVVISGANSGWYLPHLKDNMAIKNPKEIGKDQYNKEKQMKKWVSTMFSFLFGDGAVAFVLSGKKIGQHGIKIGKISHAVNFSDADYKHACVRMIHQYTNNLYEYELTAGHDVLNRSLEYSKKVLCELKDMDEFNENKASEYMKNMKKVMIHTGSLKILDGFKKLYNLDENQIKESYETLQEFGNLTGCSIPTVLEKSFSDMNPTERGLLIGITMGFGLDMVEIEKV